MRVILADNQDITRMGMMFVCQSIDGADVKRVSDKYGLLEQLRDWDDAIIVIDHALFNINDVNDLQVIHDRFPHASWILFSSELASDFVRRALSLGSSFSVLLKESTLEEIRYCFQYAIRHQSYICQAMAEQLFSMGVEESTEDHKLTPTEIEILKDIALGKTTREISEKRISSFHTVNTHRKNIFRKLHVNNVHDAIKYALRAGLVDSAEYYI